MNPAHRWTRRFHLTALPAVLLVSSILSAQPAQRVSQRLARNDDEGCITVEAPEPLAALREFALYAARSPRAPLPRPGGPPRVDCVSYQSIVR